MSSCQCENRRASVDGLPVVAIGDVAAEPQSRVEPTLGCGACATDPAQSDRSATAAQSRRIMLRLGLAVFCAMNVMAFTMALWSQDVYGAIVDSAAWVDSLRGLLRYLAMLFALPVLWLLGGPICGGVWQALRGGRITTDLLIMLGVVAAYVYSIWTVIVGVGHTYFEVGCMVLIFVTLGRWLEARGKQQTAASLDALTKLLPDRVRVLRNGSMQEISREAVACRDVLRVLPGERFAVDGMITAGSADIDEQILTGESRTVTKGSGDQVYSGTRNLNGDLQVQVTAAAGRETISRLLELVCRAREAKGRHARLADRVATWFVPMVCLIATGTAAWHTLASGPDVGILAGLAVVLIACPCALGLATPMAIWTALGRAAEEQVVFRSGEALENLAATRAIRFDKTGTLTNGVPHVADIVFDAQSDSRQVLRTAAALAAASSHSFSQAIAGHLRERCDHPQVVVTAACPGKGVTACAGASGELAALGSRRLMEEQGFQLDSQLAAALREAKRDDASTAYVGWGGRVRGVFVFEEGLRAEAPAAVADCRQLGLDVAVLTGDHPLRAQQVAAQLQLPVHPELLPADKVAAVQRAGQVFGRVAMVGDGLNDAPALSAADVGVAMGCGADLSRDAADVCLLSNDLQRVGWGVALARRTVATIRQNLFWAFFYNALGIGLAVSGRLNPVWAALAMAVSSGIVVTNSLRLARFPFPSTSGREPMSSSPHRRETHHAA